MRDWLGTLEMYHAVLADTISRALQVEVAKFPLGVSYPSKPYLETLTQQHNAERAALGLAPATDMSDFDVNDPGEWASLTFVVANDLEQIRLAAGVI